MVVVIEEEEEGSSAVVVVEEEGTTTGLRGFSLLSFLPRVPRRGLRDLGAAGVVESSVVGAATAEGVGVGVGVGLEVEATEEGGC